MESGSGLVEDILILFWMVFSIAVCAFGGMGLASSLLKEPRSYERLLSYKREIVRARKEREFILLDPDRDMAGLPIEADDPRYTESDDQRIRVAAENLRNEESYRSRRNIFAGVVAVLTWLALNGLMIELGNRNL